MKDFTELNKTLIENIKKMNDILAKKIDTYSAVIEVTTYKTKYNEYGKGRFENDGKDFHTDIYVIDCSECKSEDDAEVMAYDFCTDVEFLHDECDTGRCIETDVLRINVNVPIENARVIVGEYLGLINNK